MTLRARIIDITPVLVLFAIVSAFATVVFVEYVVNQPLRAPATHTSDATPDPTLVRDPRA